MSYSLTNLGSNITATSNANIGIGTTIPWGKVHIHNNVTNQDVRLILSDATTGASNIDGFHMIKANNGLCSLWNFENRDLRFGTSNMEVMRAYGSNLGIGTTVANYRLDVNGIVNATEFRLNGAVFTGGGGGGGGGTNWSNIALTASSNIIYVTSNLVNRASIGIGTNNPGFTLDVRGDIYAQNSVYAGDDIVAGYSDIRLKNVVCNIENSLNIIENISAFKYIPNALAQGFDIQCNKVEVGVSAQDVQRVLPEVVRLAPFDCSNLSTGEIISKSGENYLTVRYERIVPLLIEGIKELKMRIEKLENKVHT